MSIELRYDSAGDTHKHINRVFTLLVGVTSNLQTRGALHDASKLTEPEKPLFDRLTPKLKKLTYGTDEYKASLAELGFGLKHHYEVNSHHPEHYQWHCPVCQGQYNKAAYDKAPQGPNDTGTRYCPRCCEYGVTYETALEAKPALGINGMSLLDLVEMMCDWKAAGERHEDGSMERSLRVNRERFQIGDQLHAVLENTARELGWLK